MRITLTDQDGERLMNGEVAEGPETNWVTNSIDAAWAYLRHTGADSITVRSKDQPASETGEYVRIATVALEIHDE